MEPKDLTKIVNRSIEDAKQELISITGVFWVIERRDAWDVLYYPVRGGWTKDIHKAKKFLTREDAEYYINNVDPILKGWCTVMEHAYF